MTKLQDERDADDQARELFEKYSRRLAALRERFLTQSWQVASMRKKLYSPRFERSFRRSAEGQFDVNDSADLWRLLANITQRKAQQKVRFHSAQCRSVNRETPQGTVDISAAIDHGPGPEDSAILCDEVEAILEGLPPKYGSILWLLLENQNVSQIAKSVQVTRATVYRARELFRKRMDERMGDADSH